MKIAKDAVVSLAYQVRTKDGVLVDEATAVAPLEYLHGHNSLISGLEKALEGHVAGDKFDVEIPSAEAYGDFNDALVQNVPKNVFVGVDELSVGMRFLADTDQGPVPVEITAIDGDMVTVDGNHMLAGQDLKFNVEVIALREATAEEIAHGHIHGHGGHHHDHEGCCGGHGHDDEHECCGGHGHSHDEDDGCCGGGGRGGCGCH
ncbi:peptidylprolyl isomerase [Zophobihabitans entericus]|uniref:Peptidyl-prolyl cis-trans isomerase n=1 Tax=Zophobihabitans entericus TaxID=1635327 RepID=A0A6G9I988_9GAMM|nr:peptidylprolyl isomerase [Zophobihabitans entericus]QIQ20783.1 peptidylprolyl isomerase [Zophobihabitans entericus]